MQHTLDEKTLKNGIKILFIDLPGSKSFNLAIALNAGYRFATKDNIDKYELPHVLEHLVFDGSKNYPTNDDLQSVFSLGGGESNGFTTPYHNIFAFRNRLRNAEEILRASLDMVFHPRLSEQSFTEEYRVIENEIQEGMGDFSGNAMLYTGQQIIPSFPSSGDTQLERLPNVTYEDIAPYHKKYYGTKNTVLMVAADFSELKKTKIEKVVLEATAKVPQGKAYSFPQFEVVAANPNAAAYVPVHKSMTDTVACAIFARAGRVGRREMLALGLFGSIVSGMKSYSVNYKLRKQGLVYGIDFSPSESVESYGLELDISANNMKFNEVYAYTLGAIRDLARDGITDKQFESARQDFVDGFEQSVESGEAIIGWYLQDYLMDGTLYTPADFADMATTITQAEMLEVVQEVLAYDNLYHAVFSAKAFRASSSMELLAKEVLSNRKAVTDELIAQHALPLGDEDVRYGAVTRLLLAAVLVIFLMPLGFGIWQDSLSGIFLREIGLPWSILVPIYFALLFISPSVMKGKELRIAFLQMTVVFVGFMAILAMFDWGLFVTPFISGEMFIRVLSWLLIGSLGATLAAALYGAREVLKWRRKANEQEQVATANYRKEK